MNFRTRIKKVDFDPMRTWNLGVIVFLAVIVILIVLNIYIFRSVQKDFEAAEGTGAVFQPKKINGELLEEIIDDIEKREALFESSLIRGPEI